MIIIIVSRFTLVWGPPCRTLPLFPGCQTSKVSSVRSLQQSCLFPCPRSLPGISRINIKIILMVNFVIYMIINLMINMVMMMSIMVNMMIMILKTMIYLIISKMMMMTINLMMMMSMMSMMIDLMMMVLTLSSSSIIFIIMSSKAPNTGPESDRSSVIWASS